MAEADIQQLARAAGAAAEASQTELWAEHAPAVRAFRIVARQWRVAGTMAGLFYLSLDVLAVKALWTDHGITATPKLWADVGILEDETRALLNKGLSR